LSQAKEKHMKKLTQAEEQIMQVIWNLPDGGFLKDIIELLPEPKAHSNTIATLVKILVEKEFVQITNPNRNNLYSAKISKSEYSGLRMAGLTDSFFEGSYANVVSFLVDKNQMSIDDLETLIQQLKSKQND
jgi:BlaI family penicillinase repressor